MTKMIKMSLVAAVAVAGFTTSASAMSSGETDVSEIQHMVHSLKKIDIHGFVQYTMEKTSGDKGVGTTSAAIKANDKKNEAQHDIDIRATIGVKVNDHTKVVVRIDERNDDDTDASGGNTVSNASPLRMDIDRAYMSYTNNGLKVNYGLLGAPLTDGAAADGVIASKNLGGATVVGGYLYTTSPAAEDEVAFVGVKGKAGMLGYHAALASIIDSDVNAGVDNSATVMAINLSANLSAVKVGLDYQSKTGMATGMDDQSQAKLSLSGKAGKISYGLAYAMNGKDGGSTQIDGSDTAATTIDMGNTSLHNAGDAKGIQANVGMGLSGGNSIKLAYAVVDSKTDANDENTIKITYGMKMSKNFKTFVNYEINGESEMNELTLGAKYSF